MEISLRQVRAFGTAGLTTIALFAIAALIPNDAIAFVGWLIAVVLGVPVSVLTRVYFARSAVSSGRSAPASFVYLRRGLGALSVLLGVVILGWQAYGLIARQSPEFRSLAAFSQAVLAVALIGLGYRLLRKS